MKNINKKTVAGPAKAGNINKGVAPMNTIVSFQVLKNLVYSTEITGGALVRHAGVSKKSGKEYDFTQWEIPVTIDGIQVGTMTSPDFMPKSRLHNGVRKVSKMFAWTFKEWQSVTLDEVKAEYGEAFWEGDSVNETTGKVNHKLGFSKKDGNKEITIWLYKNLGNDKDKTYRAQIVLKYVNFVDQK